MSGERKSMPVSSGRARCQAHGLALGPDNQCVLCRREAPPPAERSPLPTGSSNSASLIGRLAFGLVGVSIVALTLFFALHQRESSRGAPPMVAPAPATERAVSPQPSADKLSAPHRSPTESSRWRESASPSRSPAPAFDGRSVEPSPPRDERVRAPRLGDVDRSPTQASLSQEELRRYLGQVQVELYTTSWCGYCQQARAFLQGNGVSFREYDVESDPSAAERKRTLVSGSGVPVARIDGQVLSGFSATRYGEAIRRSLERRSGVPVELTLR